MSITSSILVVDDDPNHLNLMKMYLPSFVDNVEVDVAPHPEDAVKIIESKKDPYPIIWSNYNFDNSRMNGLTFLAIAFEVSPLSSRLLCSAQFSEYEMIELVISGAIQTYATKPFISGQVSGSIKIGIEYHKVNVLGEFVDVIDFTSVDQLDANIKRAGEVNDIFKGELKLETKNHKAELNNLLVHLDTTIKKFQIPIARQVALQIELEGQKGNEEVLKKINTFQREISSLEVYLTRSKIMAQNHFSEVAKIRTLTSKTDKQIQRLKDEFIDE